MSETKDKYYPISPEQREIAYQILEDEGCMPTIFDIRQDEFGNEFFYVVDQDSDLSENRKRKYLIDIK